MQFQVIDDTYRPSPIWLQNLIKVRQMHRKAVKEDWTIKRLIKECLKLGVCPIINLSRIVRPNKIL